MTSSKSTAGRSAASRPSLFIVGSPRSGTTLLTHLVNKHLDVHVSRDAGVLLRFARLQGYYGSLSDDATLKRLIADLYDDFFFKQRFLERGLQLRPDELFASLQDRTYAGLADHILQMTAAGLGKSGWGNKKPSYALELDEVARLFPTAKFVHIVRDGRDVVLSMRRATDSLFEQNWYFAARDWRHHVLEGRRLGHHIPAGRYLELKYEDLIRDPFAALSSLVDYMGSEAGSVARLAESREALQASVRPGNFDKWRREMPVSAQRTVEMAAGNALSAFGYELAYPELRGRSVNPLSVWLFSLDRLGRKVYGRDLRKSIKYRAEWLLTGLRVRSRGRRSAPSESRSTAKP